MIEFMPPEDLPPLAPFPDFVVAPQTAEDALPAEAPLLSDAQRQEFMRVAGSLEGLEMPPASGGSASSAADDFLLGPSPVQPAGAFGGKREVLAEEPVMNVDFLAVPGQESPAVPRPVEGFNLQSLAASLAETTPPAPVAAPPAAVPGDWDLPSLFTAPAPAPAPATAPEFKPIVLPAPEPPPVAKPVAAPASRQSAAPAVEKPHPVFPPAPAPAPVPESSFPMFPPPRPVEPEPDFDEPLAFPVPSARDALAIAPAEETGDPNDRGIGMVISGALLIILGIFLACRVPALALEADATAVSTRSGADVTVKHLHGEMFLSAAAAAACLILGIGSATLRRWAPPLIHATSWVVLMTVLVGMGLTTASMFYLSSNKTAGDAVPVDGTALFVGAGVLGIALPLGLIALFQRPSVARLCMQVDPRRRWTDSRAVPALMVFVTGIMLAAAAFTLSVAGAAIPLFGEIRDDGSGAQAWAGLGVILCLATGFVAAGKRAGWWMLLVFSAVMAAALYLTFSRHDWHLMAGLPASSAANPVTGIMAASVLLPAIVILFMTRGAFSRAGGHA
ncbi:MAG TPA: hypothetical protein VG796_08710 [Verrucomicrobiales bacterium]|nr:hypothetical protein [Verrucomicrobiales bacterium]